jgi:hydroxymethylpyrimidine/phosphomethylpyrimidine kinase
MNNEDWTPPVALTIAGSDSGGGAGIQADLKAFNSIGVHGCSAVTVLTAQNSRGVDALHAAPAGFVEQQINTVLSDFEVTAAKTGMLFNSAIIKTVARLAGRLENLVVDPVMVATSGDSLLAEEAEKILVDELLPLAGIVTPNLAEAEKIASVLELPDYGEPEELAQALACRLGGPNVLLKGGHLPAGAATDYLASPSGGVKEYSVKRIETNNTHGTGCSYSALIAGYLARGTGLYEAVGRSKEDLTEAIKKGYKPGQGAGTLNFF